MINAIVDLSHHNASVDFAALAGAGIAGVIHKATQGAGYVDPTYTARQAQARTVGLRWGAYHFGDGSAVLLVLTHTGNLWRLYRGTERRFERARVLTRLFDRRR